MNLKLYITKQNYDNLAGGDWPSYENFVLGTRTSNQKINQELDDLVNLLKQRGTKFPIRTATSCQSKWTWSTIYLNQLSTASCHRVKPTRFNLHDFDNFHNIPKKLQDRKLMLEGKWPTGGCEYCRDIEHAGGFSDRMHNLEIAGLTPPELDHDSTAIAVTPRIVEIFAQNTCNLSCTYCNDSLSSKIAEENRKFGAFNKDGVSIPVYNIPETTEEYFEKFLLWLEKNITTLRRLHLLGGETFLQEKLFTSVLDIIAKVPNKELELCVFSNLNVPDKLWNHYTDRIKDLQKANNIKYFDLTASIDCWGKEAEYARFGLKIDKFEQRLAWASEQQDWLRLNVNQTLTCLTMHSMPELIEKINLYGKNKHIGHYFQFYTGPAMFQHPQTFAYNKWEKIFDRIYDTMPKNTVHQLEAIPRMQGLQKQLQLVKETNLKDMKKLHIYLDELDRRRNTNWREIFPYLQD
jgi:organic radical activating enzyme